MLPHFFILPKLFILKNKKPFCYVAIVGKYRNKVRVSLPVLIFCSILIGIVPIIIGEVFHLDPEFLNRVEQKYGNSARKLLVTWEDMITSDTSKTDREKLEKVNQFFNQVEYREDIYHWGQKDYWATPIEFLVTFGGDCEDYTIAKYFTLKAMGMADEKLNLTYVKALTYNVHHMVLTYYSTPGSEPLVLDNIEPDIRPASERQDLLPIYSFNGTGLWLAKERGKGKFAGSSNRLQRWQDLMHRMAAGNI
ncbi:MAG: transglutaminase-like cysteine peptidase [Deltaproteobacteria bacterium]|jgi:predicted transglutaminase-like cysteine proteinase|nr:transglutaminase-like cysteine peptidase [Deltaproteobacteria bacterium]